jgi:predicted AlkP superfamily pyrophosphatase or phosphodiesterase
MKKTYSVGFALLIILSESIFAQSKTQNKNSQPKLIVGIVIDQMRYDYIYRYWDKFSENGFKKLVQQGYFCKNTNFNYVPTYTGPGHASIYTGTTPAVHGIIANDWYDKSTQKNNYCVTDNSVNTVGSNAEEGKRSPKNLLSTTITDELRISTNMKSKVIGIALKDRSAILPAGHTANAAYWFDGSSGNFISSTYYMNDLPEWLKHFNQQKLAEKYLSQPWKTTLPIEQYTESLPDDNPFETLFKGETKPTFPHNLPELKEKNGNYGLIRFTPFGNSITKDLAIETIKNEHLGEDNFADFLTISFSSPDYIGHYFGPNSIEQEDDYIKLDKDLAELIAFIEKTIGKNNALVFLTADHAAPEVPAYLGSLKIPAGYIDDQKIAQLLKAELYGIYSDSLVLSFTNQQVFLNRKVIESKKLNLAEVQNKAAFILLKNKEISEIITSEQLNAAYFQSGIKHLMQNGFHAQRSGDVLVNYLPAYVEYMKTGTTHGSPYSYDTHVPLLFYGFTIAPGFTAQSVEIPDISATLAMLLNIQFPNGCTGKVIEQLIKK